MLVDSPCCSPGRSFGVCSQNMLGAVTRDGTYVRRTGSGATRKTTRREERRIVWQALVDPTVTHSTTQSDVLPLTPKHRRLRLQWCHARSTWNGTDWQNVVFSDESRFVLGTDDNHVRVWRRPGERYNSTHVVARHIARTAGVMVWRAITYASRFTLIVVRVTLTGQRYVDDILRPHVGPCLNRLPGAIFQHTARITQDFLRHIQTLPWPARSPDLSPIEHVWDQLKLQMPLLHSVHDLVVAVQDLWVHLPQDHIRRLINTMPNRVEACIAAGGGPTSY
ncbi:Transposable element Tcb2 transposase [Araneus ventricosus]|uniref:Transposable element Tcb2 transposase n=1 Tax=Araneus ventricosus TaxID=182803 RepID=A0A4Y2B266_ARAVE|nr:Transposable element Tcb2 transposase [Araneus ventricosus]